MGIMDVLWGSVLSHFKKVAKAVNTFFVHDKCLFPDHHAFKSTEFAKEDLLTIIHHQFYPRHKGKA